MKVKYYEDIEIEKNRKSVFLAGPTPRSKDVKSWRPEALEMLEKLGFDGDVYVPEVKEGMDFVVKADYSDIISWELNHLGRADAIVIWVPRDLKDMPAFTTNVEFGYHLKTGKVVYGRPNGAPKTRYLDYLYEKDYGKKPFETLEELLKNVVDLLKDRPQQVFFTSDTHFGADRTRRPFKSVEEMDDKMIRNWNRLVRGEDLVYHIGDFGEKSTIKNLNGNVVLIMGNYEREDMAKNYNNNFEEYRNHLISLGFKDVIQDCLTIELAGEKLFLTHEPLSCKVDVFNLFGHVHNLCMIKDFGLNVGTDNFGFKPATLDDVLFYKNAIKNYYDQNVYCKKSDLTN